MRYDILVNYDTLMFSGKDDASFITNTEEEEYIKVAYAVDSLVRYDDKVSLRNIKIITGIPTGDLENFIEFILSCEEAAINKYTS